MESTVDWIEGSKNPETCALDVWGFECRFANRVCISLPSQRQSPSLDSKLGVIVPRGTEFDVLSHLVVRKDHLYPFVEPLDNRCQVFLGVESGIPQLLWLWVE